MEGAPLAQSHSDELLEELRVKEVVFGPVEASELKVKPNLRLLGPKLGAELVSVRKALEAGDFEQLPDGGFRAADHDLSAEEVLVERRGKEGWSVAASDGVTVALDSRLDEELEREGRVYDLIHRVNSMRKEAGLALTDRIALTLPETDRDLLEHQDWIARETLAVSVDAGGSELAFEDSVARDVEDPASVRLDPRSPAEVAGAFDEERVERPEWLQELALMGGDLVPLGDVVGERPDVDPARERVRHAEDVCQGLERTLDGCAFELLPVGDRPAFDRAAERVLEPGRGNERPQRLVVAGLRGGEERCTRLFDGCRKTRVSRPRRSRWWSRSSSP